MTEEEKQAKLATLDELREMLMQDLTPIEQDMQSVQVMAEDEDGLKEGLEVAQDIVEEGPESLMEDAMEMAEEDVDADEEVEDIDMDISDMDMDSDTRTDVDSELAAKSDEELEAMYEALKMRLGR